MTQELLNATIEALTDCMSLLTVSGKNTKAEVAYRLGKARLALIGERTQRAFERDLTEIEEEIVFGVISMNYDTIEGCIKQSEGERMPTTYDDAIKEVKKLWNGNELTSPNIAIKALEQAKKEHELLELYRELVNMYEIEEDDLMKIKALEEELK